MSSVKIQRALVERVRTAATPVGLPNRPAPKALPRYVIQYAPNIVQRVTISGHSLWQSEILVQVETELGKYPKENDDLVQALIDLFPLDLRLDDDVRIMRCPDPRPPISDSSAFIRPVYVRGWLAC